MKTVTISHWQNQDLQGVKGYVASYSIQDGVKELFSIDLLKQKGFYQLCEFTQEASQGNFMIEQTNRAGTPKVAAFDKQSGLMLGAFKSNSLVDPDEAFVFQVQEFGKTNQIPLMEEFGASEDDFIALDAAQNPAVLFIHLPKTQGQKTSLFAKIKSLASNMTHPKNDVFQLVILKNSLCDERMYYAIGVILHDRGGLQLN